MVVRVQFWSGNNLGFSSATVVMAAASAGALLFPAAGSGACHPRRKDSRSLVIAASSVSEIKINVGMLEARILLADNTGRLDLSDCGLTEVPPSVWQLQSLTDLSLAGNQLTHIPPELANLRNLRRLGLAGNLLEALPESIEALERLEGLWLHGNILRALPSQIGSLARLRLLALSGNQLRHLPCVRFLRNLEVLSVAGNRLTELPTGVGALSKLRVLAAHGNRLQSLPEEISSLENLQDLWLQGNCLEELPSKGGLKALRQLSLADNRLNSFSPSWGKLTNLETLWLYGNLLEALPSTLEEAKHLRQIWLESNPLDKKALHGLLPTIAHLQAVGLDSQQTNGGDYSFDKEAFPGNVKVGHIAGSGNAATGGGYFKIQRWDPSNNFDSKKAPLVIVAFGSAPGVPNWAGLLRKVRAKMENGPLPPAFDVLFVVDSTRSWYTHSDLTENGSENGAEREGDTGEIGQYYAKELQIVFREYERVLMLGDSMGASAALLFSEMATSVLAFCPQVDLVTSAIRPGMGLPWQRAFGGQLREAVKQTGAKVRVHCGSWGHDTEQARLLESPKVGVQVHPVDSHRLAVELDGNGELERIVLEAVEGELKDFKF